MYLKGYDIKISNGQFINVPKSDYAGDKPWTNSHWHKIIESLKEINLANYPLIVKDLDNTNKRELMLKNMTELERWLKLTFKYVG